MVETTKTKSNKSLTENSWMRDVIIPVMLIGLAVIILWWVKSTAIIPNTFKPFILASGILVVAAAFLETLIIVAKILDFLITNTTKYGKKLL